MNKYSLTMINRNGYTIKHEGKTIESLKNFAKFYPLEVFFAWIYDKSNDEMLYQNEYKNKFHKCTNESFIPLY